MGSLAVRVDGHSQGRTRMDIDQIRKLRKAESEAEAAVAAAREEAREMVNKAHQDGDALSRKLEQKAQHQASLVRKDAKVAGQKRMDDILERSRKEEQAFLENNRSKVERSAEDVVNELFATVMDDGDD